MEKNPLGRPSDLTYIIAEMACSHEGDPGLARKIIDGAGAARADAIQFQIWSLKDMVVPNHPDYPVLQRIELSRSAWTELSHYVRTSNPQLQIIACVYETGSVDFCEELGVDAYKIHSADLSNPSLLSYVARTGKRIDLSVGASTIDEIQAALECIRESLETERGRQPNVWLMYGYQGFPTPTDAINLDYMLKLRELFELPIGYQDHSAGDSDAAFWLPAAAVGMGVNILEKHITHDRSFKGIDHQAALNPDEFLKFVEMVREIERARGCRTPRPFSPEEMKYRKYSKKSMVARRDLPSGAVLTENDLLFMRAIDLGLPPDQAKRVTGRTTKREIKSYDLILEEDLA
ncbi:MAG TPA: N-acetylneuraminate synthase family protein [Pyrinomonadaceae bacterium]|nr:N-acetylneuraminate synthase family protein [Pyrinomonadaceae bacterium]